MPHLKIDHPTINLYSAEEPTLSKIAASPAIGSPWPGIAGSLYAGISRGEDGAPDAHLILLDAKPDEAVDWDSAVKWAESQGGGARLPTRFESALLFANLRDQMDTGSWHWTGTQCSERYAWGQYFDYGTQDIDAKSFKASARAVRLIQLTV